MLASFSPRQERLFEQVSLGQLYCSTLLFLLGTTWIFVPGSDLGRDAWIAALLGLVTGLPLILLYARIAAIFPGRMPPEWLPQLCGKFLGRAIAYLYAVYFLYIAARNVRDIAELLRLSFLQNTPVAAIALTQGLVIGLAAYYGIETSGRVKQTLFPIVMVMFAMIMSGLIPESHGHHLFPLMEYGLPPVWHYAFPLTTLVPYGECVVMLCYLPFVRGRPLKALLGAALTGGGLLILITLMSILVIGPANLVSSAIPFYTVVRRIGAASIINRLDGVIVPMICFCAYVKAAKLMLGASYSLARLRGASRPGRLALALGLLIGGWAVFMAGSFAEHLDIGLKVVPYAFHVPMQLLLPLLLWLLAEWRRWRGRLPEPSIGQRTELPSRRTQLVVFGVALVIWFGALTPGIHQKRQVIEDVFHTVGHVVGEPVVRLLGGHGQAE